MTIETHLIRLSDDATAPLIQGVLAVVLGHGGKIEMAVGRVIIASFDSAYTDRIRKKPGVKLIGGICFRGRKIPKIVKKVTRSD
ncbi:MAG: hypothetical protein PHV51_00245 [Methanosarcinaceae archaeon]|nr:hypothetical protein [Methanosarcinaceae archaeon]MDD4496577.1 hypothetical protein [Methanosarcinaceae archaeon]